MLKGKHLKSLFAMGVLMTLLFPSVIFAAGPVQIQGFMVNQDGSVPDATDIQVVAYVEGDEAHTLTVANGFVQVFKNPTFTIFFFSDGNFPSIPEVGTNIIVSVTNTNNHQLKSITHTKTTSGTQNLLDSSDTAPFNLEMPALQSIAITPVDPDVTVPNTQQFKAMGTFEGVGDPVDITDSVTWNSSDDDKGTIDAAGLFSSNHVGTTDITATQSSVTSNTSTVTVLVGPADTIAYVSGDAQTKIVGTALDNPFVVKVTDAKGNPVSATAVTFAVTAGGGTLSVENTTTGTDGTASSILTLGTTTGANTVTATSGGLTGSPVTFNATGTACALSAGRSTVDATTPVVADGVATSMITITAKDQYGNAIQGKAVTVSSTGSNNTLSDPADTDASGETTATLASTKAETKTISATIDGVAITDTAEVVFTAGPAAKIELTADPTQISSSAISESTLTAIILDAKDNVVTTGPDSTANVTFSATDTTYGDIKAEETTVAAVAGVAISHVVSKIHETGGNIPCTAGAGALPQATVTVKTVPRTLVTIDIEIVAGGLASSASPKVGETVQFKATGTYDDESTDDITGSVTWNSSSDNIGTMEAGGLFNAVEEGSTNVTATLAGVTSNTVVMNVQAAEPVVFDTTKLPETMTAGETIDFGAVTSGGTGAGFTYTFDSQPTGDPGTLTDGKFSVDETKAFAGVYVIKATDINSGASVLYTLKVPIKLTPDSKAFTETKLDGNANPQTFTLSGADGDYTWEILDSETATTEVDTPADYGTWSDSGTATEILTPANVDAVKTFYIRITVENDADLDDDNGLNKRVFGPFNLIPVDTFTVTVSDSDGAAIDGANVSVDYVAPNTSTQVADKATVNGEAAFTLPDAGGTYSYTVTAADKVSQEVSFKSKEVDVTLEDIGDTITGIVKDTGGTAMAGATVTAYQPSDITAKYQATTAGDGTYTINLPVGAAQSGWTVVASAAGYVSEKLTDIVAGAADANFRGVDTGLQQKTVISVTASEPGDDTVVLSITANPAFSAGDASEASVSLTSGTGSVTVNGEAAGTITATYDVVEAFTVVIKGDTSGDNDPDPTQGDLYAASKAFSYIPNVDETATKIKTDDVDAAGGTTTPIDCTNLGQTTTVEVPVGGLTKDATIVIKQVPKTTTATTTQASPTYVYEITATDSATGDELTADEVARIEITLPIDLSVINPGDLENGIFVIYHADSLAILEAGGGAAVSTRSIISTDYVGDGSVGSVTFWVNSLSVFGIGGAAGVGGVSLIDTTDDSRCFIATAAYGSPFEEHVKTLRQFRDMYLMPTKAGHAFVDAYYRYSPRIASFIAGHDSLRAMVRVALLPVVGMSYAMLHLGLSGILLTLAILLFLSLGLAGIRHWHIKRILFMAVPLLIAGLLLAQTARAQDNKYYLGLYGLYTYESLDEQQTKDKFSGPIVVDFDDSWGGQLRGGKNLSKYFSLEAMFEYIAPFEAMSGDNKDKLDVMNFNINGKITYPAWKRFIPYPYVILGVGAMNAYEDITFNGATSKTSDWGVGLRGGLGMDLYLHQNFSVGLEGAYVVGLGDVDHVKYTILTVGLVYHF